MSKMKYFESPADGMIVAAEIAPVTVSNPVITYDGKVISQEQADQIEQHVFNHNLGDENLPTTKFTETAWPESTKAAFDKFHKAELDKVMKNNGNGKK